MVSLLRFAGWLLVCWGFCPAALWAADVAELQKALIGGRYSQAVSLGEQGLAAGTGEEDWPLGLGQALMIQGRYTNAAQVVTNALEQFPFSLRIRLLAREVALFNNQSNRAEELLEEVGQLVNRRPWAYRDAPNLVALGKAALLLGSDPKKVLENTFDRARKADPSCREAQLASAEVALDKNDPPLAVKLLSESMKTFGEDPDFLYLMARAYSGGDRKLMLKYLSEALEQNENHVPSYLLLADHLIDAEEYEEAESRLVKVLEVNPNHPEAWALRAVMSHLKNEEAQEQKDRDRALKFYPQNPRVDHLIGRKLSQKYRFAEGAEYQQRALRFAPNYVPAQSQLAQLRTAR